MENYQQGIENVTRTELKIIFYCIVAINDCVETLIENTWLHISSCIQYFQKSSVIYSEIFRNKNGAHFYTTFFFLSKLSSSRSLFIQVRNTVLRRMLHLVAAKVVNWPISAEFGPRWTTQSKKIRYNCRGGNAVEQVRNGEEEAFDRTDRSRSIAIRILAKQCPRAVRASCDTARR